jgi:nucleotide-binding universal stress UspA family protein
MGFASHIFVATDFSDASRAAIDAAADIAKSAGSRVTLFHAFDPEPLVPPGAIPNPREFRDKIAKEMETAIREKLAEIRASSLAGVKNVSIVVSEARSAAHAICEAAEDAGADLLVVATHGRTGLRHLFIGSVAERVVRHAHCAVLAVRPAE